MNYLCCPIFQNNAENFPSILKARMAHNIIIHAHTQYPTKKVGFVFPFAFMLA